MIHIYKEPEEKKAKIKDTPFDSHFRYRTLKDVWEDPHEEIYWMEIKIDFENFNIIRFG